MFISLMINGGVDSGWVVRSVHLCQFSKKQLNVHTGTTFQPLQPLIRYVPVPKCIVGSSAQLLTPFPTLYKCESRIIIKLKVSFYICLLPLASPSVWVLGGINLKISIISDKILMSLLWFFKICIQHSPYFILTHAITREKVHEKYYQMSKN